MRRGDFGAGGFSAIAFGLVFAAADNLSFSAHGGERPEVSACARCASP
jgi:hypothetical protein